MFRVFICSRPKRTGVILNQKLESCMSMVQLPALLPRQYYSCTTDICYLCISRVVLLCQPFQSELRDFQHTFVLQTVVIPKQFTQEHWKYLWNGRNEAVSLESQVTIQITTSSNRVSLQRSQGGISQLETGSTFPASFFPSFFHSSFVCSFFCSFILFSLGQGMIIPRKYYP